jgi:lysophospholipase L1-like esterase
MNFNFTSILGFNFCLFFILISLNSGGTQTGYDTTRIFNTMAKARRGENITIGVIGGSITQGYAASSASTRWANLMTNWWISNFPNSKVSLINAGIGATGSDIGAFRVHDDLLVNKPDFVVVEFSVNDLEGTKASETMEGLIRQILADSNHPGVMMLILKQSNGTSALNSHKPVAEHYGVPVISFAELIDAQVAHDGVSLASAYLSDGLHLVDEGMKYAAQFITNELTRIYHSLPVKDSNVPLVTTQLPDPLFSDLYATTFKYDCTNLIPDLNDGWQLGTHDWHSSTPGSELIFTVDGNAIGFLYSRDYTTDRGRVDVWLDNEAPQILDAYWSNNWGPTMVLYLFGEALNGGDHKLHIKIIDGNTAGSAGHYFQLLNVVKAGHITDVSAVSVDYDVKVYPVPVGKILFVEYQLLEQGVIDVSLFSITGKLIAKLKQEHMYPGKQQLNFNVDQLSIMDGFYILKIQINQTLVFKKILIRK